MEESNIVTYKEIAERIDIKEYTFRSALHRDALRLKDFKRVVESLGYEIYVVKK